MTEYVLYTTECFNEEMLCSGNDFIYVSVFTLVSCSAYSILKMKGIYIPLKRWLKFNGLHSVMSKKMIFFIITVVRTSNHKPLI
jgi:hypothetical protein